MIIMIILILYTFRSYIQANSNKNQQLGGLDGLDDINQGNKNNTAPSDPLGYIHDMRENDVPYSMRCGIDLNLRVGAWFIVTPIEVSLFYISCFMFFLNNIYDFLSYFRELNYVMLNGKRMF